MKNPLAQDGYVVVSGNQLPDFTWMIEGIEIDSDFDLAEVVKVQSALAAENGVNFDESDIEEAYDVLCVVIDSQLVSTAEKEIEVIDATYVAYDKASYTLDDAEARKIMDTHLEEALSYYYPKCIRDYRMDAQLEAIEQADY